MARIDAGNQPAVGADEEIGDAPRHALQARQAAAARARAVGPRGHVADAIADQRHGAVEQIRHEDRAHFAGRGGAVRRFDLKVQPFGHDVQPAVRGTFAGHAR